MKLYNEEYNSIRNYTVLVRNLPKHFSEPDIIKYF